MRDYYGERRFEQVAESNAIEGNTLSAGETELAVLKGITITGHDPAFVKDAISLDRALTRVSEIARDNAPTNVQQLLEIHGLILGERPGSGIFRSEQVSIRGSEHTPPKTWSQVMDQMEEWEKWSSANRTLPAPIRASVLHAWLTHVHPFIDGNSRTARAIGNLELIRAGYPPIIIKKKEKHRYIECLGESDSGGDIRSFFEIVLDRLEGAFIGLELSAKRKQGFDPVLAKIRQQQEKQLQVLLASIQLLGRMVEHDISRSLEAVGGSCYVHLFPEPLDMEEYVELCVGNSVPRTWAFILSIETHGLPKQEKLAYIGHRSAAMHQYLDHQGGASLFWSAKNPTGVPKWQSDPESSPFAVGITSLAGQGDKWLARKITGEISSMQTTELARYVAEHMMAQLNS